MKFKLIALLLIFASCGTAPSVDVQNLQKKYKRVHRIDNYTYITIDSLGVYDVRVGFDGVEYSKVKID